MHEKLVRVATSREGTQCWGFGETGAFLLMGLSFVPFEYAVMSEKSHLLHKACLDYQ